ncbi:MAG: hypothetical protein K0S76_1087 [Herbinix sp.]|jgi:putative nucleotidyltransferase with HDIG domain|nr:hypothetical protein [Herbinix sp.]
MSKNVEFCNTCDERKEHPTCGHVKMMKSQKILTNQAIPGMIVAEDIYTKDNHLIIAIHTTLTDKIITRLKFYAITDISIFIENDLPPVPQDVSPPSYYEEIKNSEAFMRFHSAYQTMLFGIKESLNDIVAEEKEIDTAKLLEDVSNIINQCNTDFELFQLLHCLRHYDDTTYVHSLNVSLICYIIGKWLKYTPGDLDSITLCGLLHDVGKLMIPSRIIAKPSKLTEDEYSIVKTHALRGYHLLKSKKIDPRIKLAALMHHERCDGSGYPHGFRSNQINSFAKLVSIADVYDAMTSARVYRGPLCPFEVIDLFETEGYQKYDPKFIMTFLEGIVQIHIHNKVLLSNNEIGEIVSINKMALSRPLIKVGDQFIDLAKQRDLIIERLI